MARTTTIVAALAAGLALVTGSVSATACDLIKGRTTYDSQQRIVGDPFFGGYFGNARNGSSFIQRVPAKPIKIAGFSLGAAGSDITSDKSKILIKVRTMENTWVTLLDLREVVVNRGFSFDNQGKVIGPIVERFPPIEVRAIRVEMKGNGWFLLEHFTPIVEGCSY